MSTTTNGTIVPSFIRQALASFDHSNPTTFSLQCQAMAEAVTEEREFQASEIARLEDDGNPNHGPYAFTLAEFADALQGRYDTAPIHAPDGERISAVITIDTMESSEDREAAWERSFAISPSEDFDLVGKECGL